MIGLATSLERVLELVEDEDLSIGLSVWEILNSEWPCGASIELKKKKKRGERVSRGDGLVVNFKE